MAALDASAVAALLVELGRRTALAGDNYFRAKAYQRAADRLSALVEPLDRVIAGEPSLPGARDQRVFKGIESDILSDGSLDYPDDVLRRFDFIIGSIHGQFRLDPKAQTERLVRAASNPFVTIIGHMTGRQLLRRPGYELDIERVLRACAEHGVAVEVNGNPWRLDLDWRWLRRALELGCTFSINPDAHSTREIVSSTRWGLAIARKSGIPADCVVNALDRDRFALWFDSRQERTRSPPRASACKRLEPA
jgi:DNA polymerase (family X)